MPTDPAPIRPLPVRDSDAAPGDGRSVGEIWSSKLASADFSAATFWLALPEVQERINRKASRGTGHWINYCVDKFVGSRRPVERMLSIGCGAGELERHLAALGAFRHCDAWDLAADGVRRAEEAAAAAGLHHVSYAVRDISRTALAPDSYDAVWFNSSLHHVEALEDVCAAVARSLKADGLLFINEYVGPSVFAFDARQRQAMRAAFELIPARLRRSCLAATREVLAEPLLPTPAAVRAADPSEAVRSAEIPAILERHFQIVERNDFGGTLLQFLLHGIAGNFRAEDPDSLRVLSMLFAIEDTLIDVKDLSSDFTVIVARPKRAADAAAHGR
jgi:SAM-dependent methyltransferase